MNEFLWSDLNEPLPSIPSCQILYFFRFFHQNYHY